MKRRAGDNYKSTLNMELEQDWLFTLGATLGDRQKIKKYYSSYKDFSGKSLQCHIVEVRMHNKLTKFYENRWSHL